MKKRIVICILLLATAAIALFACNKKTFTVTFVLGNGEKNIVWHEGDPLPDDPSRGSDVFLGWFYQSDGEQATLADLLSGLKEGVVRVAKWQPASGDEAQ